MLTDIHIENFRGFADLKLEGLSRVNLLVGKNNSGKTSLLEAIALIADPLKLQSLPGMFRANPKAVQDRFFNWLIKNGASNATLSADTGGQFIKLQHKNQPPLLPSRGGSYSSYSLPNEFMVLVGTAAAPLRTSALSTSLNTPEDMIATFAEAVRAPESERQMEELLRSLDKRIRTVRLDYANGNPFIAVDVGLGERIPLANAGDGICRLVSIFSELLGQRPQVLFIDEIENGIHHTALPKLWQGIAEAAERLDVQVFATTHSGECLAAAHEVFSERPEYGLSVIQLYALEDGADGRVLDKAHIAAALAGEIELR